MSRKHRLPQRSPSMPPAAVPTQRRPVDVGEPQMGAGQGPASPEQMRARRDLMATLIGLGLTRPMARDAIRDRTTPSTSDDASAVVSKMRAREELGAPLSDWQCDYAYDAVRRDLAERFERDRGTARAAQAERLERDLVEQRRLARTAVETRPGPNGRMRPPSGKQTAAAARLWHNVSRHEELLGKVTGTLAPVKIEVDANVNVRESLLAVVAALTPEQQDEIVREQAYLEGLAGRNR